jgi:hypothetical protein
VTNFREKLDELNVQIAKFDAMQVQVEESEKALVMIKEERDKALDAVHDLVRGLNDMLPTRPSEESPTEEGSEEPAPLRAWQGNPY